MMTAERNGLLVDLGPESSVPLGEGRVFRIGDRMVAVFRTRSGEVYATQDRCPHRGGPLVDGILGGSTIVCPLHSSKFDVSTGRPIGNDCEALTTFPITVSPLGNLVVTIPD